MDRQICSEGHILASRGSPRDAKLTQGTDLSIDTLHTWIHFLARLNAAKLDFHTIYLKNATIFKLKCFEVIVTCALSDEIA